MLDQSRSHLNEARELWEQGNYEDSGRVLYRGIPQSERPYWSAAVLDIAVTHLDVWMCTVWELQRATRKKRRWRAGYALFEQIRKTTLRLLNRKVRTNIQERMLCQCGVAENVAKVIYNATNPTYPFDDDAGEWLVLNLKSCLDCVNDPLFEEAVTTFLFRDATSEAIAFSKE